jgi:hypothetical protein
MVAEAHLGSEASAGVMVSAAVAAATCLKICVLRDGQPIVQVSFPAYAILNLTDLVPDEVKPHIAAHNLDLEDLATRFAARGCPPGELFSLPGPNSTVRAWME